MKTIKTWLTTIAVLLCSISASAHDFVVDGIYYNITSDSTVQVTYKGTYCDSYTNEYSGNVTIPSVITYSNKEYSVTSIGESAFYYCYGLRSVTIPNSVTSIGESAFSDCDGLTSVHISDIAAWCKIVFSGYESNPLYYANHLYMNGEEITDLVIPNSVTSIGASAFRGCSGLTSVTIPNSVTSIGASAFSGCYGLTSVTIPNSVTSIGNYAFYDCNLRHLTIGTGVLTIGSNQSKPTKVIWLTNTPPTGYDNLSGVINYVANENYTNLSNTHVYKYLSSNFEVDGIVYVPVNPSARTCDAISCNYDDTITSVNIGESVSYKGVAMSVKNVMPYTGYRQTSIKTLNISHKGDIGDNAFSECTSLSNINLGDSIKTIGESAFSGCIKLAEVQIPSKVKTLPQYCFYGTSSLTKIELNNGLEIIGPHCFDGSGIPELSIPASMTEIADYTFQNCTRLSDIVIEDRDSELTLGSNGSSPLFASCPLDSVYIGGKIKYNTTESYGYSPFYRNTSLRTIVIADIEEEIYDNEFYGCTNLKNVTMGSGVKKIGNWAFSGCNNLDYFSFGSGMQNIGEEAFSDCTNLSKLISYAEVPPTCGSIALDDINKWECVLQVPKNSLAAYQAADQWKEFFFIENVLETGINEVKSENGNVKTPIFDLSGRRVENAQKGIYIQNGKKIFVK